MVWLALLVALTLASAAQDPAALDSQARELAAKQQRAEAEELWNQAIRISPEYFPALFNLGYFYFQQQRFAEAEPLLRRATGAAPDDFNAHYLLGVTLLKLHRSDDALRQWRDALRIQPSNLRLMQVMSVEYSKGRYFGEAAALAKKALDLNSQDPNLYFLAIKAYQDAGDYAAAGEIVLVLGEGRGDELTALVGQDQRAGILFFPREHAEGTIQRPRIEDRDERTHPVAR